jgi:sugar/nucleoside kinase (ribokinase family)
MLHLEGYLVQDHELVEQAVRLAKENRLIVSLDLASYNIVEANREFMREIIRDYVDIIFANEEEAKALTGKEPKKALDEISRITRIAVVKTGEKGSLVKQGKETAEIPAIPVRVIDTTGAGDLYASGFLFGLVNGWPLKRCGETGALLAGQVIEVLGAKLKEEQWMEVMGKIMKQ